LKKLRAMIPYWGSEPKLLENKGISNTPSAQPDSQSEYNL
jgi:hypothetical protein